MRRIFVMTAIVLSAFLVARAIPKRTEVSLTAGSAVTVDDIVDATAGRVPEFCVGFVRQAEASFSTRTMASPYELANARHHAVMQCINRIKGETPS